GVGSTVRDAGRALGVAGDRHQTRQRVVGGHVDLLPPGDEPDTGPVLEGRPDGEGAVGQVGVGDADGGVAGRLRRAAQQLDGGVGQGGGGGGGGAGAVRACRTGAVVVYVVIGYELAGGTTAIRNTGVCVLRRA